MGHVGKMASVQEVEGLREAYAAEANAVARFGDVQRRLAQAKADIVLRQRDREMMAGRASRGEDITGADLRKAAEAIMDAEATVTLLTDALPLTADEVAKAMAKRSSAEHRTKLLATSHLQRALDDAEAALQAATAVRARALADMTHIPHDTREALDEVMHTHGRDAWTNATAADIARLVEVRRQQKQAERPLAPWPAVGGQAA